MVMQNSRKKESFIAWKDNIHARIDIPEILIYSFVYYLTMKKNTDCIAEVKNKSPNQWNVKTKETFIDFIETIADE